MALTYEQIMQKPGKRLSLQITYTQNGTTTTINHDNIFNAKPYYNSQLVGTIMHGFECETTTELPKDTGITLTVTARYNSDTQTRVYGPYYVKESKYNADKRDYTNECYDSFLNTMVEYQPLEDDETLNIEFPISIYDFFIALVTKCGFTTNITKLPNGGNMIESDIYAGINYTYRNVFDDIGQATASCFYLDGIEIKIAELGGNKTITGKNLLDINGDYNYPSSYPIKTLFINGNVKTTNNLLSVRSAGKSLSFLEPNTKYTISANLVETTSTNANYKAGIQILNGLSGNISILVGMYYTTLGNKNYTFTTPSDTSNLWISFNNYGNDSYSVFSNIQLEKGSTTSYEPYENPNITIQDGADSFLTGCNIEGNSYQYTTTGKNKFNINAALGRGLSYSNGVYTIDGTIDRFSNQVTNVSIPAGTYKFSYDVVGGNTNNLYMVAYCGSTPYYLETGSTLTVPDVITKYQIYVANNTFTIQFKNLQLESGSTKTSYEPYTGGIASPNPSYPQEVEVVETYNLLSTPFTQYNNNTLRSEISNFKAGTYTLSFDMETSAGNQVTARKIVSGTTTQITYKYNAKDLTLTLDEDATLQLEIYKTGVLLSDISKVMLNKGNIIENYIPYNNIGVNVVGKNLFDKDNVKIGYTWNNTASSGRSVYYIETEPNKTYTISANDWNDIFYDIVYLDHIGATTNLYESGWYNPDTYPSKTFTTTTGTNILCIHFKYTSAGNIPMTQTMFDNATIQLEEGNITTPIDLQNNFIGKIGSIKDELNIDDLGNVILTKRIGKVVLDNTNYAERGTTGTNAYYLGVNIQTPTDNNAILCMSNMFQPVAFVNRANGLDVTYSQNGYVKLRTANNTSINWSDVTNCKNWLDTNKPIVYYVLATPYQVNLGKANITLNEGTNYITFLTGLDTRNTIEYRSSTPQITIDDDILMNKNIEFVGKVGPINSIIITRAEESDSIYKRDETATAWYEYKIADNQLMNNNDRDTFIDDIYHKLYGITYDIYDCELTGYGGFEPFTKIRINTGDNQYNSYVFNNEMIFNQGFRENIFAEETEQTQSNYQVMDTTDKRVNEAYLILNKQNRTLTAQVERMDIIATHIDETNGNVTEVTTTTGFTFNADGLNIYTNDNTYNTQINNVGTYYKDGTTILSQTTKDGTKTKDLDIFGYNRYCEDDINDDPQFIAVKYMDGNNEEGYGHFYNGV